MRHLQRICGYVCVNGRHIQIYYHIHNNDKARCKRVAERGYETLYRLASSGKAHAGFPLHIIEAVPNHGKSANIDCTERNARDYEERNARPEIVVAKKIDDETGNGT